MGNIQLMQLINSLDNFSQLMDERLEEIRDEITNLTSSLEEQHQQLCHQLDKSGIVIKK